MRTAIQLDPAASEKAIDSAIHTHAPVVLESSAFPDITLNGFLICGDRQALLIEVTGHPPVDFADLADAVCDVRIYTDQRYCFSATITATPAWGASRAIAIARPATISVLDRRRSLRAKLAPSSKVALHWEHAGTLRRHTVNLLNISPDGMACRLEDSIAAWLEKRECLKVVFHLPNRRESFELEACVTNKTPGSAGWTILGLQFVTTPTDAGAIEALRAAIEGRRPAPAESSVCV